MMCARMRSIQPEKHNKLTYVVKLEKTSLYLNIPLNDLNIKWKSRRDKGAMFERGVLCHDVIHLIPN
jgi:hypothetical protein